MCLAMAMANEFFSYTPALKRPTSGPPSQVYAAVTGRREQNRIDTRERILATVLHLAQTQEWPTITVEMVADGAQISRRTFFNYFPSLEVALHEPLRELTQDLAAHLAFQAEVSVQAHRHDPRFQIPVLDQIAPAIRSTVSIEKLATTARVVAMKDRYPSLRMPQLAAWEESISQLMFHDAEATPNMRIAMNAMIRAAFGAVQAAFDIWGDEIRGEVTQADIHRLLDLIDQSIDLVRNGFSRPSWLTDADLESGGLPPSFFSPTQPTG